MLVKNPKYHKSISTKQKLLLQILYKFRYASTDLVAEFVGKDKSTIYEGYYVLIKQGYVHKVYDKSYRLRQRPAIYCLASKGIKYLRDSEDSYYRESVLRNYYKNKKTSEEHIDHCLTVFEFYLTLSRQTGTKFNIYSKYELDKDAFPNPPPDLYLASRSDAEDAPDYVLDVFKPQTLMWILKKRLRQYQVDSEEKDDEISPNVLLVAQNNSTEKRLFKLTEDAMQDFKFYITTQERLLSSKDGEVWIDVDESYEDELVRIQL